MDVRPQLTGWRRSIWRVARWLLNWIDRKIDLKQDEKALLRRRAGFKTKGFWHGGFFVLTSQRLAFRDMSKGGMSLVSGRPKQIDIPLNSVSSVSVGKQKRSISNPFPAEYLELQLRSGGVYRFHVEKPDVWARRVHDLLPNQD
jgi:hypothetical protein